MKTAIVFNHPGADYTTSLLTDGLRGLSDWVYWCPGRTSLLTLSKLAPEASCWIGPPDNGTLPENLFSWIRKGADLVVVESPASALGSDAAEVAKQFGIPAAAVDGSDFPNLEALEGLLPKGPWFIREYRKGMDLRARPLPFSFNPRVTPKLVPWRERNIDVLWAGKPEYGGRAEFLDALDGLPAEVKVRCVRGRGLTFDEWNDALSHSKTCLVLRGQGALTFRHFECAAAGVVPLVQYHNGVIPNDIPDLAAPRFSTPGEMIDTIQSVLYKNGTRLRHMAEEAYVFTWENHTPVHRAAEFLTAIFGSRFNE